LNFLKQSNEEQLQLIGIGYKILDGSSLEDLSWNNMYEGGFLVKKW